MAGANGNGNGNGNGHAKRPRRNGTITKTERERFLELLREGHSRMEACEGIGRTGTKIRSLERRDPEFAAQVAEADSSYGRPAIRDRLRRTLLERAVEPNASNRFLHMALMLYDAEYRDAYSRSRVEMTGADGGPVEVANVEGAAERLRARLAPVVAIGSRRTQD